MPESLQRPAAALLIAATLAFSWGTVTGQQPNFSGTWQLDKAASEVVGEQGLAGLGGAAPEYLHVTQARNGSMVLSSRANPSRSRGYQIGGESRVPAAGGDDARIAVRTQWQGESLVTEGAGTAEGVAVSVSERMSLRDRGEILELIVETSVGGNAVSNRLVFRRQPR